MNKKQENMIKKSRIIRIKITKIKNILQKNKEYKNQN